MENKELFIEERLDRIADYINEKRRASIEEIMKNFEISRTTARRDLINLEQRNLLTRSRGGALKKKNFTCEYTLDEKKVLNSEEKKKIAKIAKKYIKNGDIIYLSGGTTTLELAKLLYDFEDLLVFTNAINILLELVSHRNIKIKIFGGDFRRKTFSLVGYDTTSLVRKYNFQKTFIGANGVTIDEGVTTPNELEAKIDGEVIRRTKETFLLVDNSKFGTITYSQICELNEIDFIITDKKLDNIFIDKLKINNVKVLYK